VKNKFLILFVLLFACSPYKKVTISMSEIQTKSWMGKSESDIVNQLGNYKQRDIIDRGFKLIYDYSTYRMPVKPNGVTVGISNNQILDNRGNLMVSRMDARSNNMTTNYRNQQLEAVKVKVLEFYLDKDKKVEFVNALGYPDSIHFELRRK
jgi:hypothetical protein